MQDLIAKCEREHARLVGMLGLYCGDGAVAEDLAQEALIRLCRDWRKVRKLEAPERWLYRVAINLAHSHFRRAATERRAHSHFRRAATERRALSLVRGRTTQRTESGTDIETLELLKNLPHRQKTAWEAIQLPKIIYGEPVVAGEVLLFAGASHESQQNSLWVYAPPSGGP